MKIPITAHASSMQHQAYVRKSSSIFEETGAIVSLIAAVAIGALFSLIIETKYADDQFAVGMMCCSMAILTIALIRNVLSIKENPAELFSLIYLIFYYILPGIIHLSIGVFPFYNQVYAPIDSTRGAVIILIFSIAYVLGRDIRFQITHKKKRLSSAVLIYGSWILLLAGVGSAFGVGLQYFLTSRGDLVELGDSLDPIKNIMYALAHQMPFTALLIGLILSGERKAKIGARILLIFTLPIFLILNNPLSIPRSLFASYAISSLVFLFPFKKKLKILSIFILVIAQFTIFPMLSALQRGNIYAMLSSYSPIEFFSRNGDFDGYQSTINVGIYATQTGLKWGHNLLSAFLFFVPRPYWPSKSIGTGGEAGQFMNYQFINLSSPLPSEFFVDFGYVGVAIGGFLYALLTKWWDSLIEVARDANDNISMLPYACLVGWIFILLRGSLVGDVGPATVSFFIAQLLIFVSGRFEAS